jgi:hypothetical protein
MTMAHREGFISADISEMWAGYYAHLVTEWKDGKSEERSIPCRTKEEAEEIVEKFLTGEYNAEG